MEQRNRKQDKKNAKRNLKNSGRSDRANKHLLNTALHKKRNLKNSGRSDRHKKLIALELVSKAAELNALYQRAQELGLLVESTTCIHELRFVFEKEKYFLGIKVYDKIV